MDAPTHYANVSEIALEAKDKYNLTDTQTLLYNHICRGDFKLRNGDGQNFYDKDNNGFGWDGSREWVKKQFQPLIDDGLVKFTSLHDCRDRKYTSWYFYCPQFDFNDLVDASCYVSTIKLAMIKHCLNLEDGFDKKNKIYGDIEFIYNENRKHSCYTFKYKGEDSVYAWDNNGKGKKQDLSWLNQGGIKYPVYQPTFTIPLYYTSFQNMMHDIWSFLVHDGYQYVSHIPNYTNERVFTI